MDNKNESRKEELHKSIELLYSQGNNQQNEERIYATGENICKPYISKETDTQNI